MLRSGINWFYLGCHDCSPLVLSALLTARKPSMFTVIIALDVLKIAIDGSYDCHLHSFWISGMNMHGTISSNEGHLLHRHRDED